LLPEGVRESYPGADKFVCISDELLSIVREKGELIRARKTFRTACGRVPVLMYLTKALLSKRLLAIVSVGINTGRN
jgi:hypothetical protein